jgi:hypothetical protein
MVLKHIKFETFVMFGDVLGVTTGVGMRIAVIQWVEARDSAEYPNTAQDDPQPRKWLR